MENMDEILSYWTSKSEDFPEGIRAREETGCCATYAVNLDVDPATGAPHA